MTRRSSSTPSEAPEAPEELESVNRAHPPAVFSEAAEEEAEARELELSEMQLQLVEAKIRWAELEFEKEEYRGTLPPPPFSPLTALYPLASTSTSCLFRPRAPAQPPARRARRRPAAGAANPTSPPAPRPQSHVHLTLAPPCLPTSTLPLTRWRSTRRSSRCSWRRAAARPRGCARTTRRYKLI